MRVFNETNSHPHRVNIIDDCNVLVGFDMESNCCEDFDYKLTKIEPLTYQHLKELAAIEETDLPGYDFDTSFKKDLESDDPYCGNEGAVTFMAVNDAGDKIFVSFMNSHNGYYSHGFSMKRGKTEIFGGSL